MPNRDKELTRVPQPLSGDIRLMERTYGIHGQLITDLLIFLSSLQIKDIWGNLEFSTKDFCQKMRYDRTNLQRKLTIEEREKLFGKDNMPVYKNATGQQIIETVFESALWVAMEKNIIFTRQITKGDNVEIGMTGVQLIKHVNINCNYATKKKIEKTYLITLGDMVKDFMLTNYNLIELKDYREMPNIAGYRNFYLILSRILVVIKYKQSQNQNPFYISTVDDLAMVLGSRHTRNADKKKFVTQTLNKINDLLGVTKFSYEYISYNGSRHKYHVKFEFADETLEYFDEKSRAVFFKALFLACEKLYMDKFYPELKRPLDRISMFKRIMGDIDMTGEMNDRAIFWKWFNSEEDKEKKSAIYNKVFWEIFKIHPNEVEDFNPLG